MVALRIDRWRGLAPRFNRRQIPIGAAQIARNLRFDSGDMKPLQKAISSNLPPLGGVGAEIGNLFWYRRGDKTRFGAFGENMRVSGMRSPVPEDSHNRWYFNIHGSNDEDGLFAVDLTDPDVPYPPGSAGSGANYRDFIGYKVGVPAPQEAPVASKADASLAEVGHGTDNGITSLSRTNPMTVNTASEHDFELGQRVRLKVDEDYPRPDDGEEGDGPPPENGGNDNPDDGQVWALDGLEGVVRDVSANSFDLLGISTTGFQEFTDNDLQALNIKRLLTDSELESRSYVFTYVTEFDEEGPPSEPSNIIDIEKEGVASLQVGDSSFDPDDGGSRQWVNRIRIYRTVAGDSDTLFVLVGTLPYDGGQSQDSSVAWTSEPSAPSPENEWTGDIEDSVESVSLGEPLPSDGWYPPAAGLEGVELMPNGILVGWKENELHFSEPYLPHAWNPDYVKTLDHDIVGAQVAAGTLVVGTRGRPYVVQGADPASMQDRKLNQHAPLLHPRAIADAGDGVIYSADNGLVWANAGGAQVITSNWTKQTWLPAVENRDRMEYFDGYAFLYAPGVEPLVLSLIEGQAESAYLDEDFSAAVRRDNSLAIVKKQSGGPYRAIHYFNEDRDNEGSPVRMTGVHRSGMVSIRRPVNVAVGQVFADGYPITLKVRSPKPTSYPDPVEGQPDLEDFREHEYTVEGPEPFRLVPGYMSREYEIEIESEHRVESVLLATSMDDLRSQDG